jgi:diacylglycerol kinase (ATP)
MNNKPKYTIFKNSQYAFEGLIHAIKTETSFKLELFFGFFIIIGIIYMPIELSYKLILLISLFIIFIAELLNSAVENVVDLVTKEIHPLAKTAKDLGATAVLFSVVLHILCWGFILIYKL